MVFPMPSPKPEVTVEVLNKPLLVLRQQLQDAAIKLDEEEADAILHKFAISLLILLMTCKIWHHTLSLNS